MGLQRAPENDEANAQAKEQANYYSMLKWGLKKQRLFLLYDMTTKDKTKDMAVDREIIFDQNVTGDTEIQCKEAVNRFIKTYSEPQGEYQWNMNLGRVLHDQIWEAAKRVWGFPRFCSTVVFYVNYDEHWQENRLIRSRHPRQGTTGYSRCRKPCDREQGTRIELPNIDVGTRA
jgi:hypothetical protein